MTADEPAEMPGHMLPSEFEALVLSLYPSIANCGCGFEICRSGGPNHTSVIPLPIPSGASQPYWCPDRLKSIIKRRTKIVVRPLQQIDITQLSDTPVSHLNHID